MKSSILNLLFCLPLIVFTQTIPQGINYQAVARNANGDVLTSQSLVLKFSIISNISSGTISWQETHISSTNNFGLFSVVIGEGTSTGLGTSTNFNDIDWGSSNHFLGVEIDYGSGFTYMGTTSFNSVPYANFASQSNSTNNVKWIDISNIPTDIQDGDDIDDADNNPSNEIQNLTLTGTNLSIENGNTVDLSSLNSNDNLGNHIATQNLDLDTNNIENVKILEFKRGGQLNSITTNTDGQLLINVNSPSSNENAITIDDDSRYIGIGTSTPQEKLHVEGTTRLNDHLKLLDAMYLYTQNSHLRGYLRADSAAPHLRIATSGGESIGFYDGGLNGQMNMLIDGYGNVGIGTSTPQEKLHVNGNAIINGELIVNGLTMDSLENTGVGLYTLTDNISGNKNTAIGYGAMHENISGESNSALGVYALYYNVDGSENTAIGRSAMQNNVDGSQNTAIGRSAMQNNVDGSQNTGIGFSALYDNVDGNYNTAIGRSALYYNVDGSENTAIGRTALFYNVDGNYNTAIGVSALYSNMDGSNNTAIGLAAMKNNISGASNSALGLYALYSNIDGSENTAIGRSALYSNVDGLYNNALGRSALYSNMDGSNNTAIGRESMYDNTSGYSNSTLGNYSLADNIDGYSNVAIGFQSLRYNTDGYRNIAIGYRANYNSSATSYNNTIAIGALASVNASNQVRIGNSSITSIGGYANWSNVSDKRFKKNINENVLGLEFIKKLRPVTYNLDVEAIARFNKIPEDERSLDSESAKSSIIQSGFIAQEVEQAAKEIGYNFSGVDKTDNANDSYSIRYAEFVVPLVKAIQEQQEIIDRQGKAITNLQQELKKLNQIKPN